MTEDDLVRFMGWLIILIPLGAVLGLILHLMLGS